MALIDAGLGDRRDGGRGSATRRLESRSWRECESRSSLSEKMGQRRHDDRNVGSTSPWSRGVDSPVDERVKEPALDEREKRGTDVCVSGQTDSSLKPSCTKSPARKTFSLFFHSHTSQETRDERSRKKGRRSSGRTGLQSACCCIASSSNSHNAHTSPVAADAPDPVIRSSFTLFLPLVLLSLTAALTAFHLHLHTLSFPKTRESPLIWLQEWVQPILMTAATAGTHLIHGVENNALVHLRVHTNTGICNRKIRVS